MASSCDMNIYLGVPILVGSIAGAASALGFIFITPFLEKKGIDTCGVLFSQGVPGILSAIVSSIIAGSPSITGHNALQTL